MYWYVILSFIILSVVYSRSKMAVDKLNFEFENNDCTIIVDGICTGRSVRYNIDGKIYSTIWEYIYNDEVYYGELLSSSEKYFSSIGEKSGLKINPYNTNEIIKIVSEEDGKREKQIRKKSKIVNVICLLAILLFIFIMALLYLSVDKNFLY